MGLPDLYQVAQALSEACVHAAQGADQVVQQPGGVPAVPQIPQVTVPAVPGLDQVLINLGGWWFVLWMLIQYVTKKVSGFAEELTKRLDRLETAVGTNFATLTKAMAELNADIRTIIEKSCSDDNLPAVTEQHGRKSGSRSREGGAG